MMLNPGGTIIQCSSGEGLELEGGELGSHIPRPVPFSVTRKL